MTTPKPPEEGEPKRKLPEFIILDEEEETFHSHAYQGPKFKKMAPPQVSWKMRVLSGLLSIVTLLWTLGAFIGTIILGFLTLLTFNFFPILAKLTRVYWSWVCGGSAVTLGLLVAIFNFPLGLVIIVYYFSQASNESQRKFASRIVPPHMRDFM